MTVQAFIIVILTLIMTSLSDARSVSSAAADEEILRKSVEVVVVVDKHAYSRWRGWQEGGDGGDGEEEDLDRRTREAIEGFVQATFMGANLIWKGMEEYGVFLDLRIDSIQIVPDEDIVTPNADGKSVMNEVAFWDFHHWMIRNGFEFDHALLLTGLDLSAGDSNGHEGYAYMNTMCSPTSVSVVESIVNGIPAVVITHEVGHSLSARHDGEGNNHCNSTSGHIMNANRIGTSPSHWNFSTCSGRAIRRKIQHLTDTFDCLSEDSTRSPQLDSPYLGQLYSGDQLCQRTRGQHSYVCRHLYNRPDSPSICTVLYCLVNATYCSGVAPVDGLPCGAGKRCLAGECVPFDDVSDDVTDLCYTGDKPGLAWRDQTCGEVVASFTHLCEDQWYQDFCCSTCLGYYTGDEDCPYGDAYASCAPHYCGTRWHDDCCGTCRGRRRRGL